MSPASLPSIQSGFMPPMSSPALARPCRSASPEPSAPMSSLLQTRSYSTSSTAPMRLPMRRPLPSPSPSLHEALPSHSLKYPLHNSHHPLSPSYPPSSSSTPSSSSPSLSFSSTPSPSLSFSSSSSPSPSAHTHLHSSPYSHPHSHTFAHTHAHSFASSALLFAQPSPYQTRHLPPPHLHQAPSPEHAEAGFGDSRPAPSSQQPPRLASPTNLPHSPFVRALPSPSPSSPREMLSWSASREHGDYPHSFQSSLHPILAKQQEPHHPYYRPVPPHLESHTTQYGHYDRVASPSMLPTPTTPWSLPVKEEDVSALISFASSRPMTRADSISSLALSQADDHRRYSSRSHDENQDEADLDEHDAEVLKMETEYAHSMQSSRSSSMGLSVYSREASPCSSSSSTSSSPMTLSRGSGMATYGMLSEASTSMSSLASNESTLSLAMSESSIGSSSKEGILSSPISNRISASTMSMSSTSQLLLCPVCQRPFKPSKNQNCNLRRHLKNVHNMSPTIHPRKCKWDSLPDGRVKDDKDRKERTRKSKRLWARKFRQKRKVEEAAIVLSMLCQAA